MHLFMVIYKQRGCGERVYKTFSILFDPILLYFQVYIILNLGKTIPRVLSGFKSIWSMILATDSSVMHYNTFLVSSGILLNMLYRDVYHTIFNLEQKGNY